MLEHVDLHSLANSDMAVILEYLYAAVWLINQLYAWELHQNRSH